MSDPNARAGSIIAASVALALGAAIAWSASSLSDASQSAADAAADTAACRRFAQQITTARRSPTTRGNGDDIGPRLERAMTAAEIDGASLTRVAPQPPRMVGLTGRRSTQVVLERVSLKQALSFVASLVGDGSGGMTLESFELTVPTGEGGAGDDEWNVELAVSQVVGTGSSGRVRPHAG